MPDLEGPAPAPRRAPVTGAEMASVAAAVHRAATTAPGVALPSMSIPMQLRINGRQPYLAVTTEIRRALETAQVDYRLTCRGDAYNGLVTWDLELEAAQPGKLRNLFDWLAAVLSIES